MAKAKTSDILIRTKEILNQPGVWVRWFISTTGHVSGNDPRSLDPSLMDASKSTLKQYCLLGGIIRASEELGCHCLNDQMWGGAGELLARLAPEVAIRHKRPLDNPERLELKRGRRHNAAYFNNSAKDLSEINDLLCEGIKVALEKESEDTKGDSVVPQE